MVVILGINTTCCVCKKTLILLGFLESKVFYLKSPKSIKSLKVVKTINESNKKRPIRKKPSWVACFNGLPKIFSNR